jgi:hypothetical protein
MRFLMRMAVILALVFAVSGVIANAAETAKKAPAKKAVKKKKVVKKVEKKKVVKRVVSGKSEVLSGANLWGRPGLIFGDTAEVGEVGKLQGSGNFLYESSGLGSSLMLPFGANVVAAPNLNIFLGGAYNAFNYNTELFPDRPAASAFAITGGLKYGVKGEEESPDFSIGEDLSVPTNGAVVVATTRGCVTYTVDSKLTLNGMMGFAITDTPYFVGDAGLAYAFTPNFTGIAEVGANQLGYSNSALVAGFRAGQNSFMFQGTLGLNMSDGNFIGGAGVVLATE